MYETDNLKVCCKSVCIQSVYVIYYSISCTGHTFLTEKTNELENESNKIKTAYRHYNFQMAVSFFLWLYRLHHWVFEVEKLLCIQG